MKHLSFSAIMTLALCAGGAHANYDPARFTNEVSTGLDIISAQETIDTTPTQADGELGLEVYEIADAVDTSDTRMFIPTSMYMRMGGGLNLGFATDKAQYQDQEYKASGGYTTQIGLGWNLSSYVRTELDFQQMTLKFSELDDHVAEYQTIGGTLYFDLARRYVQTGDITRRRTFVPYMGIGAAVGTYEFQGTNGADGMVIAAPRATFGFNIMLSDLIGIDIAYQYQMMIGNGYGWDGNSGGVDNISNIMASIRANF